MRDSTALLVSLLPCLAVDHATMAVPVRVMVLTGAALAVAYTAAAARIAVRR